MWKAKQLYNKYQNVSMSILKMTILEDQFWYNDILWYLQLLYIWQYTSDHLDRFYECCHSYLNRKYTIGNTVVFLKKYDKIKYIPTQMNVHSFDNYYTPATLPYHFLKLKDSSCKFGNRFLHTCSNFQCSEEHTLNKGDKSLLIFIFKRYSKILA